MLSLVVDDDQFIRAHITMLLRREGFNTVEAEGGNPALEIVKTLGGRLDLIVSDIQMPDGDGLTFAKAVRKAFPAVPIVLVSGLMNPNTAFEFVEKPFASTTLVQVVRRLVPRAAKTA